MQFWSKIFCYDVTAIICWFDKDDLDDSIFNVLCDKLITYVYMFGASSGSDIFGHEDSPYIVNMENYWKLDLDLHAL